jgi:hypothetical protein
MVSKLQMENIDDILLITSKKLMKNQVNSSFSEIIMQKNSQFRLEKQLLSNLKKVGGLGS